MRLLALTGSLRRDSYNRMLLDAAARELPDGVGCDLVEDLRELPHYSEDADVEPGAPGRRPAARRAWSGLGPCFSM